MAIHAHSTLASVVQARLLRVRSDLPPEPLLAAADLAQAIQMRRRLEAALDHGTALLAALGLPAIGDALDLAISTLDALDAPGADLEDGHDAEHDTADAEPWLGWPNAFTAILDVAAPHDLDLEEVNEDGGGQYDPAWWEGHTGRHTPLREVVHA